MADEGMYVANRNVLVETKYGHMIRFEKDVPLYVPPIAREAALAVGVLPVNGELPVVEESEKPVEPIGPARVRAVKAAVQKIVERNDTDDFTGGGIPKEAAVLKAAGFRVARREINEAYKKLMAERQE